MKIDERWSALIADPEKPVFQLLDAEHPLKLYIGRSTGGGALFLVVDEAEPPILKSMKAIEISTSRRPDGQWNFLLELRTPELFGVFALLCEDLALSSRHISRNVSAMIFVARRVAAWRKLTEEGGRDLLTLAEVRGLVGELSQINRFLAAGIGLAETMTCWVGPFGADQDFHFHDTAWEIKTVHADAPSIRVSSERQLHTIERKLRLVVISVAELDSPVSFSLNAMVDGLRRQMQDDLKSLDLFEERLKEVGYMTRIEYENPSFLIGQVRVFRVEDGFPRITPTDVPTGVCKIDYHVLLDECASFAIDTPAAWN